MRPRRALLLDTRLWASVCLLPALFLLLLSRTLALPSLFDGASRPSRVYTHLTTIPPHQPPPPPPIKSPQLFSGALSPPPPPPPPSLPAAPPCFSVSSGRWSRLPPGAPPLVPLVAPGTSNKGTLNARGFAYLGTGGRHRLFQPASALSSEWLPAGCAYAAPGLSAPEGVAALLAHRWVHIDGDSLARDLYFDLLDSLQRVRVDRLKAHWRLAAEAGAARVSFAFTKGGETVEERCAAPASYAAAGREPAVEYPTVWIHAISLWELAHPPERVPTPEGWARIVACELARKPPGTLGILRLATVYSSRAPGANQSARVRGADEKNARLRELSRIARAAVDAYNAAAAARGATGEASTQLWHVFDPFDVLDPRKDEHPGFFVDGVHYNGVGSRTMTWGLLQLVAACDLYCAPALARGRLPPTDAVWNG